MKMKDIINQIKERIQVLESLIVGNEHNLIYMLENKHIITDYEEKILKKVNSICRVQHKIDELTNALRHIK